VLKCLVDGGACQALSLQLVRASLEEGVVFDLSWQ
jgi:hypothetical protein